jgi:hypothetical protein
VVNAHCLPLLTNLATKQSFQSVRCWQ